MLTPKIIFEDSEILVIDKPAGLVVNRAETVHKGTLQDWIERDIKIFDIKKLREENQDFYKRSGLVHRLDKDTSGVMVVAKTPEAMENIQSQFKERKVEKNYLALVHGRVEPKTGNIRLPLGRNPQDRRRFTVRLRGKTAETDYERFTLYHYPGGEFFSLLKLSPRTGRTHQLRVHLAHIGFPLVSDPLYLSHKRLIKDRRWCWRLFLHSASLSFYHPETGKKLCFTVPLPSGLRKILKKLRHV